MTNIGWLKIAMDDELRMGIRDCPDNLDIKSNDLLQITALSIRIDRNPIDVFECEIRTAT